MDVLERYLELGLRLGRHVDGLVDAYYGPREVAARVDAEEPRPATELRAEAQSLRDDIAASELDARRRAWLDDQLLGIETYASILAGDTVGYADEVERCFGVRPERTPEDTFAAAQAKLDEVLPGAGTLAERLDAWRQQTLVPEDAVLDTFERISAVLRDATRGLFGLPEGEEFETTLVRDEPWSAYNYYLGGLRSRVAINLDLPISASFLVELAAHEAYPGHHTEHALKEHDLVGNGIVEESLILVPTPQSMVSEGIAENAWQIVGDDETSAAVVGVLADAGVSFDLERAEAIAAAGKDLRFVSLNAALMLHEDGAAEDEVTAYIERWAASTPERAKSAVRFVSDPLWRSYTANYSIGGVLVRRHVAGDPARFAPLLREQTRVADLLAVSSA